MGNLLCKYEFTGTQKSSGGSTGRPSAIEAMLHVYLLPILGPNAFNACRHITQANYIRCGHAGTQSSGLVPAITTGPVAPPAVLISPGCSGNESSLLECRPDSDMEVPADAMCRSLVDLRQTLTPSARPGLQLSCITSTEQGPAMMLIVSCLACSYVCLQAATRRLVFVMQHRQLLKLCISFLQLI